MANEGPTIYADLMSQPSRAVVIFCRCERPQALPLAPGPDVSFEHLLFTLHALVTAQPPYVSAPHASSEAREELPSRCAHARVQNERAAPRRRPPG